MIAVWLAGCNSGASRVTPLNSENRGGTVGDIVYTPPPLPTPPPARESPGRPEPGDVATERQPPRQPEPAPPVGPPLYTVNTSWLNVRLAAGTDATRIARLGEGTEVELLAEEALSSGESWARIRFPSDAGRNVGWVARSYLTLKDPAPVGTGADAPPDAGQPDFGDFADLHYAPVPKRSYDGNPRIDAKGIYLTLLTLRSERLATLVKLAKDTSVNAFVIDFKDDSGHLLTKSAAATRYNAKANDSLAFDDPAPLLKRLKDEGIYLIARIVTFKDPVFAKAHPSKAIWDRAAGRAFKSSDGLTWASPHDADFRSYNLGLAKEAAKLGFNEVQFDYIRFPDVPRSADLDYRNPNGDSKADAIQSFLLDARKALEPLKVYLAADVFGLVCHTIDDMRIGQYWEAVSNAVDYICPMMYPSHYGPMNYGFEVPDQKPYEVLDHGIRDSLKRNGNLETPARLRPWIQGFTATWVKGHITYGPDQVKAQIKALADNGVKSWLVWHPGNRYNPAAVK
ncbi:MAG: SH3 domain-containing protein [Verrucomicrobiales bacterium]|nr:SH3 domain-containing protein [Verrucomicrobiales bacterium]